jgi:acyl-CoA synthetase (AMP-forming)/AMP-acid ligase II
LLYTGGTTGSAKAALGTHRSLYIAAAQLHANEDICAFCKERRVGHKVPLYVEFRATLRKTMVGKVLRQELKAEKQ